MHFNTKTAVLTSIFASVLFPIWFYRSRRRPRTTKLNGPASNSFLFGLTGDLLKALEVGAIYANWERTYGAVYEIPATLGSKLLVLGDPKAVAHVLASDTTSYHQAGRAKRFRNLVSLLLPLSLLCLLSTLTH